MTRASTIWLLFGLMAAAQMTIPALMIYDQEKVLSSGVEYRFRTAPIDPYDMMRGKYITLSYELNEVAIAQPWNEGAAAYVLLGTDSSGYATLLSAQEEIPSADVDYLALSSENYWSYQDDVLHLQLPFNRYYMEESKAKPAERLYLESNRERQQDTYALVMVKDGKAVLKDVIIDGIPIKEAVLLNNDPQFEQE